MMLPDQRVRHQQAIRAAEGYLELGMPKHALGVLVESGESHRNDGYAAFLRGEALRSLERCAEAIVWLRRAARLDPESVPVRLALGWCCKRIGRYDLAIEALEQARQVNTDDAIIHYNLACYWSLAGDKHRVIACLAQAFDIDPSYRDLVSEESDFDPVRDDPDFQSLTTVIV